MRNKEENSNTVEKICGYCTRFFDMKRSDIAEGRKRICRDCIDLELIPGKLR